MSFFSQKQSIGLTWTDDNTCYGVALISRGGQYIVTDYWRSDEQSSQEPLYAMPEGLKELQNEQNFFVTAGPVELELAFIDLVFPNLEAEDLRNALQFELNKHAPVAVEDLAWGYRFLEHSEGRKNRIRLAYTADMRWKKWLDQVSGLHHGVDALMPPALVLDPLLHERDVFMKPPAKQGYLLRTNEQGMREIALTEHPSDEAFGAGSEPLKMEGLELNELRNLSASEQQKFTAPLLLAMYGLSSELEPDKKTWISLPEELRPQRYQVSRRVAWSLGIYVIAAICFSLGMKGYESYTMLKHIRAQKQELRQQLKAQLGADFPTVLTDAVTKEVKEVSLERASMLRVLTELTERINKDWWVKDFRWRDNKIDIQVRSDKESADFLDKLKQSSIFKDVVPVRKTIDHRQQTTLHLQMYTVQSQTTEQESSEVRSESNRKR